MFASTNLIKQTTATFWMKAAVYTATGVIAYDADLPNKMAGRMSSFELELCDKHI